MYFVFPLKSPRYLTQGYTSAHKALDWGGNNTVPIYAAQDGIVNYVINKYALNDNNCDYGYGNKIRIVHGKEGTVEWATLYAHLNPNTLVKANDIVKMGEMIGFMDNNGCSTGPHLHFELQANGTGVNPLNYLVEMPPAPIVLPVFPKLPRAKTTTALNVRVAPRYGATRLYVLKLNEEFQVLGAVEEGNNLWLELGHNAYCAMLYNGEQYVIFK